MGRRGKLGRLIDWVKSDRWLELKQPSPALDSVALIGSDLGLFWQFKTLHPKDHHQ
ncbi:MAG: hypothetical protein HC772_13145 [Leptolyngbyaceae cyanobacterium CRU_2_3]|nr:hypothetical protein [Leptolyngbyaceae cyanobacterium CRU_2_3]